MSIARFNHLCKFAALGFLLLTVGGKTAWYAYRGIAQTHDFPQYYMAGLIARLGEWDALYPIPHPHSKTNPGGFQNSDLRPRYRELSRQAGIRDEDVRFVQPPPIALLLVPLSLFPLKISFYLWVMLLILAAWGIALQAGKIYGLCFGRATRMVGIIVLLVALSPMAHRWVRVSNMSVLIGWLIGCATIQLALRDGARGGAALVLGTVAKYAPAVLAPMVLVLRRWRTIAWGLVMLSALLGLSLLVMGAGPFEVFLREIAPKLGGTVVFDENQALYPTLLRMLGRSDGPLPGPLEIAFDLTRIAVILLILLLIFLKPRTFWDRPDHAFAGALALVSWMMIFSPICWEHYHAYTAPFWGWLAFQATRSWPRGVLGIGAIALSYLPTVPLLRQIAGEGFRLPEPLFSHLLCALLIMLGMSISVLAARTRRDAHGSVPLGLSDKS